MKTNKYLFIGLLLVPMIFSSCQPCDIPFWGAYFGGVNCDCDCPDDPQPPSDSLYFQPTMNDVLLGDFDGDGRADVFANQINTEQSGWFISYGGTSPFIWTNKYQNHASELMVGNFDNDNTSDIALPGSGYDYARTWMVSYAAKTEWTQLNTSYSSKEMTLLGDFNADNVDDIFYPVDGFEGPGWYVMYGGTQGWVKVNNSSSTINQLIIGDFDGNGYDDVLSSTSEGWDGPGCYVKYNYTGEWITNPGEWKKINNYVFEMKNLRIGDFDGDGKDDLLAIENSANMATSFSISYAALSELKIIPASVRNVYDVKIGDFDGDGRDDIFTIPERSADGSYNWIVYYGGRFAPEKLR